MFGRSFVLYPIYGVREAVIEALKKLTNIYMALFISFTPTFSLKHGLAPPL